MSFFDRFSTKVKNFFIDCANLTRFSETRSLSDKNCMLRNFQILKVTEKNDVKKWVREWHDTKNFELAPIRKQFRDSESASLFEQKSPPHRFPNPQGYRNTTI